jgi:site-specific recombinase XerD
MTAPRLRSPQPKQLDAGILQAEINSFALRLTAEGKAAKTIRTYTEAVQWFAAAYLPGQASWERVDSQDIQQWMTWLLDRYSNAYASNQYRALQQFFKWLSAEDELPDPMERLQPPRVTDKLVPVFTEGELSRLEQACAARSFAQRRDTAIIAVFRATGIRLAELAGIVYHADDPRRSDIDLWQREITVRGKGGRVCEIQNAETVLGVLREHHGISHLRAGCRETTASTYQEGFRCLRATEWPVRYACPVRYAWCLVRGGAA